MVIARQPLPHALSLVPSKPFVLITLLAYINSLAAHFLNPLSQSRCLLSLSVSPPFYIVVSVLCCVKPQLCLGPIFISSSQVGYEATKEDCGRNFRRCCLKRGVCS